VRALHWWNSAKSSATSPGCGLHHEKTYPLIYIAFLWHQTSQRMRGTNIVMMLCTLDTNTRVSDLDLKTWGFLIYSDGNDEQENSFDGLMSLTVSSY
jgi:hypothetical protein